MFFPSNIPWPKIHEYILEVGSERQRRALLQKALHEIHRLIPFDTAHLLYTDGKFHILHQEALQIPKSFQKTYPVYFLPSNMTKTWLPENPRLFHGTAAMYRNIAFGEEWIKPLGLDSAIGMRFIDCNGENVLFILYRSHSKIGFSDLDIAILSIIQPHLVNLSACLQTTNPATIRTIAESVKEFKQLTPREIEITILLCEGLNTQSICSKLYISQETLYRHTNNIFKKLGVANRHELIVLMMSNKG